MAFVEAFEMTEIRYSEAVASVVLLAFQSV